MDRPYPERVLHIQGEKQRKSIALNTRVDWSMEPSVSTSLGEGKSELKKDTDKLFHYLSQESMSSDSY